MLPFPSTPGQPRSGGMFGTTPLSPYIDPRRSALMGAAAGLASNGLGGMWQGAMQGQGLDLDAAERQRELEQEAQQQNATRAWLEQRGYTDLVGLVDAGQAGAAFTEALRREQPGYGDPDYTANQRDFMFAQENPEFMDYLNRSGTGRSTLGTTIYTLRDENGNLVPAQVGTDGQLRPTDMPENMTFDPGALNAARNYGSEWGRAQGQGAVQAPEAIASTTRMLEQIETLYNDPGLWWSVGGMGWTPNMPGNPQAGTISRIEQLQGAAFLQAFESLKGGGQITEIEGIKATNAIARLQRSQSYEDYREALAELREILQGALARAQTQARGGAPMPQMGGGAAPAQGGGGDPLGIR